MPERGKGLGFVPVGLHWKVEVLPSFFMLSG